MNKFNLKPSSISNKPSKACVVFAEDMYKIAFDLNYKKLFYIPLRVMRGYK